MEGNFLVTSDHPKKNTLIYAFGDKHKERWTTLVHFITVKTSEYDTTNFSNGMILHWILQINRDNNQYKI